MIASRILVMSVVAAATLGAGGSAVAAPTTAAAVLRLVAPDGARVYGGFSSNTLPTASTFFPVGVWSEQSQNALKMRGHGINTMVTVYGSSADVRSAGLFPIGPLADEVDMLYGPGNDTFNEGRAWPNSCTPAQDAGGQCGYTAMSRFVSRSPAGAMKYTNYGKGIVFWESNAQAMQFVNNYQDVVSADIYWTTDADVCSGYQGGALLPGQVYGRDVPAADCRKPSNYGITVDKVRSLVSPAGSKPVWNFVELGHPGTNGSTMPVSSIRPAVWSSLIHGARGIVYFNHSFGGSCQSQHVMDDCDPAIGAEVNRIDKQIASLAPVLNSPTVAAGVTKSGPIDQLTKWDGHNLYVLTGSTTNGPAASGSVTIGCVGNARATVLGEGRTVPVVRGTITDRWASSNAVHLYRINGGSTCGLT